jgi:hypothetical protein
MTRQQRRGAQGDGELSNAAWIEKERRDSAEPPVAPRQVGRPTTSAPQDDQLRLEQEILRDHRADTTGATEPRGHDGQVQQREQETPHVRVSVGQTSGAAQRCRILDSAPELAIRDPQASTAATCENADTSSDNEDRNGHETHGLSRVLCAFGASSLLSGDKIAGVRIHLIR